MKKYASLLAVIGAICISVAAFGDEDDDEITIVSVKGTKPFSVQEKDVVRIEAGGIAGAVVTAKVTGDAKLKKCVVRRIVDGAPVVGPSGVEFEVTPTGLGKVTVEVSVKNPNEDKPKVTKYEFTVK